MEKTKREMRQEAIKRLNKMYEAGPYTTQDIVVTLAGSSGWVGRIIDLLTDDEMDGCIELPKDANGEVIELWDKITYHGASSWYQDRVFEVRGYGAAAGRSIDSVIVRRDSHLETLAACCCKHYHKPTVDEILDELEGMRGTGDYDAVVERCADLAGMLRELLKEGEDEN